VESLDGRWKSNEPADLSIKGNEAIFSSGVLSLVIADGEVKLGEWVAVEHMQQLCFKMEGKEDIIWTKQPEFKYISTSSNIPAQNEDAPIIVGVCQQCGQRKEQHNAKGALTALNLADNNLGKTVLPDGWTKREAQSEEEYNAHGQNVVWYEHTDGMVQNNDPSRPEGVIAIANAIPDMRAMTSLNLASNSRLGVEGAKIIAAFLRKCT
jgi:hypothetical protein